jgi:hypothetical protein
MGLQIIFAVLSYERQASIVRFLCQNSRYKDGTTKACAFWVSSCSLQGIAEQPLPCKYNVIQLVIALSRR